MVSIGDLLVTLINGLMDNDKKKTGTKTCLKMHLARHQVPLLDFLNA